MPTDLELALTLAQRAADMALPLAGGRAAQHTKADGSPVTEADLAVERLIIDTLAGARPDDSVMGEETGVHGDGVRRWIIDPVDGTSSFIDGGREWGTHIALAIDGRVDVAVMTRPTEGRCWWAVAGKGAYVGGLAAPFTSAERLRVSDVDDLDHARVGGFVPLDSPVRRIVHDQLAWVDDDVSVAAALLEGRVDGFLDVGGAAWDLAPMTLLAPEAGGRYRDPWGGVRFDMGWAMCTNARIADVLWALLSLRDRADEER